MTLESKSTEDEGSVDVIKRRVARGMPELHKPPAYITKVFERWLRKHRLSGREYSEFEWDEQNLEFENFILTRNESSNRDLDEQHLDDMVEYRLTSGSDFRNINNAICFNVNGGLETGQHRAVAGIRAGIGSRHIVKIVPCGAANQSDLSKPINTKDKWKREGIAKDHSAVRKGVVRLLLAIKHNSLHASNRTDQKVHLYSQNLNGKEIFEDAVRYPAQKKHRPFSSYVTLGTAYYLIASSQEGEEFMHELFNGTDRRKHQKSINGIRKWLAKHDANSKSGDRNFRAGDDFNIRALSAIILAWNSYPREAETYVWTDTEVLVPEVRK